MAEAGEQEQAGGQRPESNRQADKTSAETADDQLSTSAAASQSDQRQQQQQQQQQQRRQSNQRPRRPRPLRPNQFRMVAVAVGGSGAGGQQRNTGEHLPVIETIGAQTLLGSGAPVESRVEIASSVLQSTPARATMVPPKRPNYPPMLPHYVARPAPYAVHAQGPKGGTSINSNSNNSNNNGSNNNNDNNQASNLGHHHLHRFQPTTSLGATALTPSSSSKPNRYSWAQMQQWHAAQAGATTMVAVDATGAPVEAASVGGVAGGQAGGAASGFHYHLPTPFSAAASRVLFVPNPIVNLSEHTKSRLVKFIEAIKRFSEKWFSHVLLLLFLASYACLGAYVFISFEASNEQWEKQLIIDTRLRIVNESYDQALASGSRELFVDALRQRLEDYERLLNRACASGMTSSSLENQWTFWGALFYSMTVFTTIGYGHLTPTTFAGRVATMIYAIFGIPILLMVLADLGKLLTRIIKYAFKKFRSMYNKLLGRKATVRTRQLIQDNTNQYIGQARHAFERGFATYIQPYQARLPHALQSRSFHLRGGPQHIAAGQGALNPEGEQPFETSDLIITPLKQTEPVSPQPEPPDDCQRELPSAPAHQVPSGSEDKQYKGDNSSEQQPGVNEHKHKNKNKDRGKRARKTSCQQLKVTEASQHQQTRRASQRQADVARSASTTNIDQASSGTDPSREPGLKRASLDQPRPSADEKLKQEGGEVRADYFDDQQQHEHHEDLERGADCPEGDFLEELDDDLDIPVSFALFLLITYMMFGAVVFSIWESWNFFDSLYFVFISMSTIGFGDLVPQHPKRMIGTFAYLLFGLALTSMCINVVQEKIHATFLRAKMQIGEKMGFDLNQIMADDYYHDGNSVYGGDDSGEDQLDENGSQANSIALSQTNSTTLTSEHTSAQLTSSAHQADQRAGGQQQAAAQQAAGADLAAPISRSKSRESLKWKKRSLSGAFGASLSCPDQQHSGGSSSGRRKVSSGANGKKAAITTVQATHRGQQASPQHPPQSPVTNLLAGGAAATSAAAGTASKEADPVGAPIKHHIETIRIVNIPVMLQQLEDKTTGPPSSPTAEQRRQQSRVNPSINQPIDGGVKAFCEPLRRAFQGGGDQRRRARLVTSRSQPSSPYQQPNGSEQRIDRALPIESRVGGGGVSTDTVPYPRAHHYSSRVCLDSSNRQRGGSNEPKARSLASSRRGSISDELHQLDDLIVALSKTPPERFGPLLGIPSSRRSSRSTSPLVASASPQKGAVPGAPSLMAGIGRGSGASPRRGASLMVRGSNESVLSEGRRTPLGQLPQDRRLGASFGSTTTTGQTTPFMTPSGSSNLLATSSSVDQQQQQQQQLARATASGQRRKSSSSSNASRFAMISARQSQNELSAGESQAALDELEAVRFSAV